MSTLWLRILALSSIAAFSTLCPNPNVRPADAAPPRPDYLLVWGDEFNGTALDTINNWGHRHPGQARGGRNAVQIRDAVSVSGGELVIRTYTKAGIHSTGMIQTGGSAAGGPCNPNPAEIVPPGNKHMPKYGYIEASIDFDGQSGMWHSFFVQTPQGLLMGPMDEHLRGMEMDIVEHRKWQGNNNVSHLAESAIHWMSQNSPVCPDTADFWHGGSGPSFGTDSLGNGFHTYGLEWTPEHLKFYYDTVLVWTVKNTTARPCNNPPNYNCGTTIPCPGEPRCSLAPVPQVNEYILLCGEVPFPHFDGYGNIPPGGFDSLGAATNPKMRVQYVRHYQLLAAPSGLIATALSTSQISLAWTDNTHAENGFKIERSIDNVNFSQIVTLPAGTTTYLDAGLGGDARYYYRVRAFIDTNLSAPSNTANAITDIEAPGVVTNLSVPSIGKRSLAVSWTAPGDDGSGQTVTQYDLRRSTSPITAANFNSATVVTTSAPHGAGFTECRLITNLSQCTTYYFAIKSRDEWGQWSAISNLPNARTACQGNPSAQCVPPPSDVIPPANVTSLSVAVIGKLNMALSWTAPGDDGTTGTASEYDFRYSASPITASNFGSAIHVIVSAPQAAGSQECQLVEGLSACRTYYFALKTKDEWGNWSGMSNVPNATTLCVQNIIAECTLGGSAANLPVPNDEAPPRLFSAPRPNPARGATSFQILVPSESQGAKLRVGVYDVAGRRVRSLVNRTATPGPAQIEWNLLDDSGRRVASALYMMRVDIGDTRKTFPLVVVR